MKLTHTPYVVLVLLLAGGCVTPAYFLSPLDVNVNAYHTIPLKSDSIKAATYGGVVLMGGGSNFQWRDAVYGLQANLYRSHNFGHFQAYYGGGVTIGNYSITAYNYDYYRWPDTTVTHGIPAANKFFGAYGFNGGINYVIPFSNGGEWRVIGIQSSIQHEFGNYLNFRKSLPDSVFETVATSPYTNTLGITSEVIWKIRNEKEFGYKMALGGSFVSPASYRGTEHNNSPFYFSNTLHLTKNNTTGFCQVNIGNNAMSVQFGFNFRLGKNKFLR